MRKAVLAVAVLALALAVSPVLLPAYRETVLFVAESALPLVLPDVGVASTGPQGWRVFRRLPDRTESAIVSIPHKSLIQIYLGAVVLPVLLVLTPGTVRRRLGLVVTGMTLLLVLQAGLLVAFLAAWVHYQRTDPDDPFYAGLTILHSTVGQLAPLPIWAALTWRQWFGPGRASMPRPKPKDGTSKRRRAA